jgi:hypothetical protein
VQVAQASPGSHMIPSETASTVAKVNDG